MWLIDPVSVILGSIQSMHSWAGRRKKKSDNLITGKEPAQIAADIGFRLREQNRLKMCISLTISKTPLALLDDGARLSLLFHHFCLVSSVGLQSPMPIRYLGPCSIAPRDCGVATCSFWLYFALSLLPDFGKPCRLLAILV